MNINKTADECIVESATVLLKCFVDPNFSLDQKQKFTKWITWFFDYQDALNHNNQKAIDFFQEKLSCSYIPLYYKNALQEFKNANLFYNKISSFKKLKKLFINYSTKQTIKTVNTFSTKFIKVIEENNIQLDKKFIENFQALIYTIHYHLSYIYQSELNKTIETFIKIIKTKITIKRNKKEILLINLILNKGKNFFSKIQQIQLINFIYKLDDIFQDNLLEEVDQKISDLIFTKPKKLNTSMNSLLKTNNISFYNEIWKDKKINEKQSKLLMHLFAYETYFIQGHNHQEIYETLILKNIIKQEKYWKIINKYKLKNKI